MQCVRNGCPLASVKDKFIIVQYQSVSPSPMFFNKKVFHHTSFHMRIFAYDARQSEIFDVSSISKNCTGYVNIFLHYFISEEFNLLFFSGIRSQYFVFFIIIIFAFQLTTLRIIITSLFKPEIFSKYKEGQLVNSASRVYGMKI